MMEFCEFSGVKYMMLYSKTLIE